jgi:hypothetical protein
MTTQERIDELKQCPAWETHVSSLEALALQLDSDLCREREAHNRLNLDYLDTLALLESRNQQLGKIKANQRQEDTQIIQATRRQERVVHDLLRAENQRLIELANRYRYVIETEFDAWSIPCRGLLAEHDELISAHNSTN